MPQGFETRPEIQSASPSGRANQPARQLSQVGVIAPRGGSTQGAGAGYRALNNLAAIGGKMLDGYVQKKQAEDEIDLELMYQQGKTLADARAAGYDSNLSKSVYQTMDLQSRINEWFTGAAVDSEGKHASLTPAEYSQNVLSAGFKELMDSIDPNDDVAREVYKTTAKQMFPKLQQRHAMAHAADVQRKSENSLYNMLTSVASGADPESTKEVVDSLGFWGEELGEEATNMVTKSAVVDTLLDGNLELYDTLGGKEGLKSKGFTPSELKSVDQALDKALSNRRITKAAERMDAETAVTAAILKGQMSLEEGIQRIQDSSDSIRLDDDYVDEWTMATLQKRKQRDEAIADLELDANPEFRREVNALLTDIGTGGLNQTHIDKMKSVGNKYGLEPRQFQDLIEDIKATADKAEATRLQNAYKAINDQVQEQKTDAKARVYSEMRPADRVAAGASTAELQRTLEVSREQAAIDAAKQWASIPTKYDAAGNELPKRPQEEYIRENTARAHSFELKHSTVIDKGVKAYFDVANALDDPIGSDNEIIPEIVDALVYYQEMSAAGMSTNQLKKYAGDRADLYDSIMLLGGIEGGTVNTDVVAKGYKALEYKGPTKANINEVMDDWRGVGAFDKSQRNWFIKSIPPNLYNSLFSGRASSKSKDIPKSEVDRAVNTGVLDVHYQRLAHAIMKQNPWMGSETVRKVTDKRFNRDTTYVAGNFLFPSGGKTPKEWAGLEDEEGDNVLNKAVIQYMKDVAVPSYKEWGIPDAPMDDTFLQMAWRVLEQTSERGPSTGGVLEAPSKIVGRLLGLRTDPVFDSSVEWVNKYTHMDQLSGGRVQVTVFADKEREQPRGTYIMDLAEVGAHFKGTLEKGATEKLTSKEVLKEPPTDRPSVTIE